MKTLRLLYCLAAMALFPVLCHGRSGIWIKGTVLDSLTRQPVPGAVVEVADTSGATLQYGMSADDGSFFFSDVPEEVLLLKISILGYRSGLVRLDVHDPGHDVGNILMQEDAIMLETAVHSDQAIRSSQSGDTLSYSAAAYKVMLGSDAESLVSRMPGISVSESGVEANGREVRRIMIDGQEYFGSEVLTALKNLPADMIRQIEVINKLSDMAELTGVDDGNGYTAINVVTRPGTRDGSLSGRLYAGYGIPDKYIAGANLNWFKGEHTASLLAMGNNISRYNFASESIVGASAVSDISTGNTFKVKPLPGLSSVQSTGVNYSNDWFSGSYFFSRIDNHDEPLNDKETFLDGGRRQVTGTASDFNALNYNHNFTSRIAWSPADNHSLVFRPSVNVQDLGDASLQKVRQSNILADGNESFLRERLVDRDNDRLAVRISGSVSYRYSFPKRGRTLSVSASGRYNKNTASESSDQYQFREESGLFDISEADSRSSQLRSRVTEQVYAGGSLTYTDRLSKRSRLSMEYRFSFNKSFGNNIVRARNTDTGELEPEPDGRQSNVNTSRFITNTAGLRYNYAFRKVTVSAYGGYQNTGFTGVYRLPVAGESSKEFHNFIYTVIANVPFDRKNSLRIDARSRTANPSVNTLQTAVNLNNMSNIRAGNPDVVPSYLHEVGLRYVHTGVEKGSTLSLSLKYTGSSNYLCDSLVIDSPDFEVADGVLLGEGNQYVKPVNLGGYSKFNGKMTYGFPVNFIRSNLNLDAEVSVSVLPGMINADRVPVYRNWYDLGARIDSNLGEFLDFSVSYSGRYTQNEYSGRFGKVNNNFITHDAKAWFKWIFWSGFSVTAAVNWRQYRSLEGRFDDRMCLCDIYIGKQLFRNGLGEISIGVNDLLDDNIRQFAHSISASGTSDTVNLGVGRYFSVQFVYHLRTRTGKSR